MKFCAAHFINYQSGIIRSSLLFLLLCFTMICHAQVDGNKFSLPTIIPNAPNAAALGRYGEIPVAMNTGVPNISVPLFNVQSGALSVPVSLDYHGSGIKVSDKSSTAGLGWSLKAGGSISRVMQGLPDEGAHIYHAQGFSKQIFPDANDPMLREKEAELAATIVESRDYFKHDGQPDLFYYSYNGKGGKFIYKNKLISGLEPGFMTIPFSPVKLSLQSTKFTLVDTDGTTYIFGDDSGNDFTQSNNFDYSSTTLVNSVHIPDMITSWHLTSMISADKSDTITFKYTKFSGMAYSHVEPNLLQEVDQLTGWFRYTYNQSTGSNYTQLREGVITEIMFKSGKITFDYAADKTLDAVHVYQKRGAAYSEIKKFTLFHSRFNVQTEDNSLRLDSLQETGMYNNQLATNPPFKFKYSKYEMMEVPPFNTKGQDFWGYFNGKTGNSDLLVVASPVSGDGTRTPLSPVSAAHKRIPDPNYMKIGTLESIQYPTGGTTYFDFEPNQTAKVERIRYDIRANYNYLTSYINESIADYVPSHEFTIDQPLVMQSTGEVIDRQYNMKLNFEGNLLCQNTSNCIPNDPTIALEDITDNQSVTSFALSNLATGQTQRESKDMYFKLQTGHRYRLYFPNPVVLSPGQMYKFMLRGVLQGIRSVTYDTTIIKDSITIYTGGLRIRKITSTDNFGKSLIKEYKYPGYYYNSSFFSGDYDDMALHINSYDAWTLPPPPPWDVTGGNRCPDAIWSKRIFTESRSVPLGSASNNSISYSEVEEYQSDNAGNVLGKTVYKYNRAMDITTASMPLYKIDKENERGLLLEKTEYKFADGIFSKVRSQVNTYADLDVLLNNKQADTVIFYTAVGLQHLLSINPETGMYAPNHGMLGDQNYFETNRYRTERFFYTSPKIVPDYTITSNYQSDQHVMKDTIWYGYTNIKHLSPSKITKRDSRGALHELRSRYVLDYPYADCINNAEVNFKQQLNVIKTNHYAAVIPVLEKYRRNIVNYRMNNPPGELACQPKNADSVAIARSSYQQLLASYESLTGSSSQLIADYNGALNNYAACAANYYNNASDDQKAIMDLQKLNNIAPELEKKEYQNGALLNTWQSFYKTFSAGVTAQSRIMASVLNNAPETRLSFGNYDQHSNLLEVSKVNDVKNVYFWGYDGQYPVAKITGSDYNTAKQYINQNILNNPLTTDAEMRAELNKLRINLPKAQVLTYTYAPLLGLTSETDAKGDIRYYEYDAMGRLSIIRDRNGNILKQFDYKYQQ